MCCLSFQPYRNPYANAAGYIFDLENIVKFVEKHQTDPISGEKTDLKAYFKLNMSKNPDGKYQCPVIFKEFNENSHIVAVRTTGNVYSFEAVDELNFKAKNLKDLITDQPFQRKDVITLQEPTNNLEKQNISKFHYLQNNLKWNDLDEGVEKVGKANLNSINQIMKATLEEMNKEEKNRDAEKHKEHMSSEVDVHRKTAATDRFNAATYSTGAVGASLTSTAMVPVAKLEAAFIGDDAYRYAQIKKKGYVQLKTNFGPLNFELYCPQTPKACENFIKLCKSNYYDNTKFHRLIKYFILQGGDPTATGKGGQSYWGKPFNDEFNNNYSHDRRGILSMANAGRNTNKSQFFVTFKSCKHLDKKHTIFGHLVGGAETLDKIEQMPVDKHDRPLEDVVIESTSVFVDPFAEVDEKLEAERQKAAEEAKASSDDRKETNKGELTEKQLENCKRKIGALIDLSKLEKMQKEANGPNAKVKRKAVADSFGNFSNW